MQSRPPPAILRKRTRKPCCGLEGVLGVLDEEGGGETVDVHMYINQVHVYIASTTHHGGHGDAEGEVLEDLLLHPQHLLAGVGVVRDVHAVAHLCDFVIRVCFSVYGFGFLWGDRPAHSATTAPRPNPPKNGQRQTKNTCMFLYVLCTSGG